MSSELLDFFDDQVSFSPFSELIHVESNSMLRYVLILKRRRLKDSLTFVLDFVSHAARPDSLLLSMCPLVGRHVAGSSRRLGFNDDVAVSGFTTLFYCRGFTKLSIQSLQTRFDFSSLIRTLFSLKSHSLPKQLSLSPALFP